MTENHDNAPVRFDTIELGAGYLLGVATLNRPQQLNALNLAMCERMLARFRAWASNESVVAVLLQGEGSKGFCAGGDVAEVVRHVRAGGPRRYVYGDAFFEVEYQLDLLIHTFPKPFISYSHGVNMGGGVGLTVGASHRLVSDGSRIAMPEIHIGLFPDVGGGWFLNRTLPGLGVLMALTGLIINEADAIQAGLADAFLPGSARDALLEGLRSISWSGDARLDRAAVTRLVHGLHDRHRDAMPQSEIGRRLDAIRHVGTQPEAASVRDALAAVATADSWFQRPADSLAGGSPTAAMVSFEYLRRARTMSLAEVLALDLVLARQYQRHHDFPEGVRALLIDKDRKPAWSPARFDDVDADLVEAHFRPLGR
ncbi:MAG: enoyl-CoA hydratase/isomerase family protein [Burkholderiaceae bacterium]|nr:enoyl-CoA hydratase/isomerase family protein [Burkholderiaceae bacterium]